MDGTGVRKQVLDGEAVSADIAVAAIGGLGLGQEIQQARLRAGLKCTTVAHDLKINENYLHAIEAMDRNALPAPAYALGFVRCYAKYLGLDAEEAVAKFKSDGFVKPVQHRTIGTVSTPFWMEFNLPKRFGFVVAAIGFIGLATWYGYSNQVAPRAIPPVPELLQSWAETPALDPVPSIIGEPTKQTASLTKD